MCHQGDSRECCDVAIKNRGLLSGAFTPGERLSIDDVEFPMRMADSFADRTGKSPENA